MKKNIFNGVGTAIVTPFYKNKVDFTSLELIIKKQLKAKVSAIIVLGTTGEPCTLTFKERELIIKKVIDLCKNKCKVIVGAGSNNTKTAIKYYKQAQNLGADGALIVTPYYNKCTQNGIIQHYTKIANSGTLPIIVYNVPSRTGVNILPQTMLELVKLNNIYGIKEASGNINQTIELFKLVGDKTNIYCGEDALNGIYLMLGGAGIISVLSNIAPALCTKMYDLIKQNNFLQANKMQLDLTDLINSLFIEVNPIPVKAGLNYLGLCKNELRLPLTPMQEQNFKILKDNINKVWGKYDCL